MTISSHTNFRLRGIPLSYEKKDSIRQLVKQTLGLKSTTLININSLAVSPSDHASRIATLSFPEIPACFSDQPRNEWTFHLEDGEDLDLSNSIVFDTHFRGFTPFHRASPDGCNVDIIAVTGLGGHALGSFKEKSGPYVWLRDGLPIDAPNMRILSYGYDTRIINSSSFQNLTDLAKSFRLDLDRINDLNHPRPIIFIAHSLGGLLVKETIVQIARESVLLGLSMLDLVSSFMFIGVPHQGLAVEFLVPMIKDSPNRGLLESLGKNSSLLSRLQREFSSAIGGRHRHVVSFYETERSLTAQELEPGKWEMTGPSAVLVEVSSATCGSLRQYPINRNHSEMVKFTSRQDDLYQRVIQALKPLLEESQSLQAVGGTPLKHNPKISLSGDQKNCLRSLSFQEQDHRYDELCYDKNTCEWLLEDLQFQAWLNGPRGLFWIKGSPGTGKSVLLKFAVEAMQRRHSTDLVVSFFIHGRGVPLQRTPSGIYRALLSSLLETFPEYLQKLTQRFRHKEERFGTYERKGGWVWTESELEEFLSKVLSRGTKANPVTIYLDALDECGEDDAKRLLQYFSKIMTMVEEEEGLLKICFSSRHYPILGLETMPTLLVEERNGHDIKLVVQNRLKRLRLREKAHQIETYILSKAQGGFQWAILATDIIRNGVLRGLNSASLHQAVTTIPKDLQKIYEFLLSGVEGEERAYMVKLFQWVLFSERPLSAHELREALTTSRDMTSSTTSELRKHPNYSDTVFELEVRVRHISRGLVEFQSREVWEVYLDGEDWDREAQFIHQSAADFVLLNFLTKASFGPHILSMSGIGHFDISRSCLKYITLQDILESSQLSRRDLSAKFPLLPYAVTFLLRHIKLVEQSNMIQPDLLELFQWHQPDRFKMLSALWLRMDPDYIHAPMGWPFVDATAPHVLVGLGSPSCLQTYLSHNKVIFDATDSYGNTPLLLALIEGREDLALLLLERSVALQDKQNSLVQDVLHDGQVGEREDHLTHVNTSNRDGETPLGVAVSTKFHRAIQSLLKAGADPKAERGVLFYSIGSSNKALLSDLIERQVCLDGAVFFAAQSLDLFFDDSDREAALLEMVSTLLNAGANTRRAPGVLQEFNLQDFDDDDDCYYFHENPRDDEDDAIILALHRNLTSVVELLVSHGASLRSKNTEGLYPLEIAMRIGCKRTVEMVSKASLESGDTTRTDVEQVLYRAIPRGRYEAASIILRDLCGDGAWSDVYTDWPASALRIAIDHNWSNLLHVLMESHDIDLSTSNKNAQSPVRQCLALGRKDLLLSMLNTGGVDIHKKEDGESPFWWTIREGNNSMIEFLLSLDKRNIHRKDLCSMTAFWWLTEGRPYECGRVAIAENALKYS